MRQSYQVEVGLSECILEGLHRSEAEVFARLAREDGEYASYLDDWRRLVEKIREQLSPSDFSMFMSLLDEMGEKERREAHRCGMRDMDGLLRYVRRGGAYSLDDEEGKVRYRVVPSSDEEKTPQHAES